MGQSHCLSEFSPGCPGIVIPEEWSVILSSSSNNVCVSMCVCVRLRLVVQSCPTLCDVVNCSPPGSSVRGIFQAKLLEWVAMPFSRGIFPTQGLTPHLLYLLHWQVDSLPLASLNSLNNMRMLIIWKIILSSYFFGVFLFLSVHELVGERGFIFLFLS